jgi:hypothetical protein
MRYIRDRDKGDPCKRSPSRGNCKTVSRKQALETGADIRVERLHSVNGDGYRTPRMARNGAVCATSRNSERETRLVGCGCSPVRTCLSLQFWEKQGDF